MCHTKAQKLLRTQPSEKTQSDIVPFSLSSALSWWNVCHAEISVFLLSLAESEGMISCPLPMWISSDSRADPVSLWVCTCCVIHIMLSRGSESHWTSFQSYVTGSVFVLLGFIFCLLGGKWLKWLFLKMVILHKMWNSIYSPACKYLKYKEKKE